MWDNVHMNIRALLRVLRDEWDHRTCKHPLYAREPHMAWTEEVIEFYEICTKCRKYLYSD